jgi:hypothetical protein
MKKIKIREIIIDNSAMHCVILDNVINSACITITEAKAMAFTLICELIDKGEMYSIETHFD